MSRKSGMNIASVFCNNDSETSRLRSRRFQRKGRKILYVLCVRWQESRGRPMKIAIAGKGGVGKTTLTALLAQAYADQRRDVLAVDADPSPCLAGALGFPPDLRAKLHPIAEMDALIEERTGAKRGTTG